MAEISIVKQSLHATTISPSNTLGFQANHAANPTLAHRVGADANHNERAARRSSLRSSAERPVHCRECYTLAVEQEVEYDSTVAVAKEEKPRKIHFIPRLILRRFAMPDQPETVIAFRADKVPLLIAVGAWGFEKDFYRTKEFDHIEKQLKSVEDDLAAGLEAVLNGGTAVTATFAAKLVAHFSIRTQNVRLALTNLFSKTLDVIKRGFKRDDFVDSLHDNALKRVQRMLKQLDPQGRGIAFRRSLGLPEAGKIRRLPRSAIKRLMENGAQAGGLRDVDEAAGAFSKLAEQALTPELIREEHTKVVLAELDAHLQPSRKFYATFRWELVRTDKPLVLGDVGPIAWAGDTVGPIMSIKKENLDRITLPLATNAFMDGFPAGRTLPAIDVDALNRGSAEASARFFVGSVVNADIVGLTGKIGSAYKLLNDDDLASIEESMFLPKGRRSARR